ncbi:MAG: amylo-alpha-1,6-glucosidase, partial [Actinomycetota bacterium]
VVSPAGEAWEPLPESAHAALRADDRATGDLRLETMHIKEGETFASADPDGDLPARNPMGTGFYYKDTRFLSRFEFRLQGTPLVLLSSSAERSFMSQVDLTNGDIWRDGLLVVPQHSLNVRRTRVAGAVIEERIRIRNYHTEPVTVRLEFALEADYADIFEVRGLRREQRGTLMAPRLDGQTVKLAYLGLDEVFRETWIHFSDLPVSLRAEGATVFAEVDLEVPVGVSRFVSLSVEPVFDGKRQPRIGFESALDRTRRSYEAWQQACTRMHTDNHLFNALLQRGVRDLRALMTPMPGGEVLAAGIPWYVAPFGRDSILSCYEILMVNPLPARDLLRLLATYQGQEVDPWRDEEPGKILHEVRQGELAGGHYIPHTPYFGTVDATPLYLMLAAAYFRWTNDLDTIVELEPVLDRCLRWIDEFGDLDGDGYVEYARRSPRGLKNQGWKDSGNSIVHRDGTLAEPPIALSEVQAYVYMAKQRMSDIYSTLGDEARAARLRAEAADLRARFNRDFWMEDEQTFALALDGDKRQVQAVTTNPAHGLYCGLINHDKAAAMAKRLMASDMFSGWGIRTMSRATSAYNPMSYHNGSVWPHDNAIVAAGLKRYGHHRATMRVATALFDVAMHMEYFRLPELFCGFTRRAPTSPVAYPVACSPQAWAAGSPFILLQAMLGISARADQNMLTVNKPLLPPWLERVELSNLRVGSTRLSLVFTREGDVTTFSLTERRGDVRVLMEE